MLSRIRTVSGMGTTIQIPGRGASAPALYLCYDDSMLLLNPFPIQWLSLFAYFLLRVFVGAILVYLGFRHLAYRKELRVVFGWSGLLLLTIEFVLGLLVLVGAFTQYAALGIMFLSLLFIVFRGKLQHKTVPERIFYVLLFACGLTLFITGAGALAVDLPV